MSIATQVADLRRLARAEWDGAEAVWDADPDLAHVKAAKAERWSREADALEGESDSPSPETAARIARWDETIHPKEEQSS
jgi:hypothetical protein